MKHPNLYLLASIAVLILTNKIGIYCLLMWVYFTYQPYAILNHDND